MSSNFGEAKLTPEQLAAIPPSFFDYVQENPGILPDYGPFSRQAFDVIKSQPDSLVVLTGPRGIGKTNVLIPALLERGQEDGFQPLGSIFSLSMHGQEETHLDPHEYHIRDKGFDSIDPGFERPFWVGTEGPGDLEQIIRERFAAAGEESLFVLDEAASAMSGTAEVIKTVLREAQDQGITLAVTQPVAKEMNAGEAEEHDHDLTRLAHMAAKSLKVMPIEVALVPQPEVIKLLDTLGIDLALAEKFEVNLLMRTLRVVEHIFHETVFMRNYGNDNVLGDDHIAKKVGASNTNIRDALGLSFREAEEIQNQFSS